jgi:predicted Holliday junction resolvase-like endonuclease
MIVLLIVIVLALLFWLYGLSKRISRLTKDLEQIGKWSAYLESTIKEGRILTMNQTRGEWEVNTKLKELLR